MLSFLFEGVKVRGRSSYAHHPRAVNDTTYFGRYMLLDIPEDDIDDELVNIVAGEGNSVDFAAKAHQLATVIDGHNEALANLALARLASIRNKSARPNIQLLQFIADRIDARSAGAEHVGSPRNALRALASRELGLSVLAGEVDAAGIVHMLGERESLHAVWAAARLLEFRARKPELVDGFARFWLERLRLDASSYLLDGQLGAVAELITFSLPPEETDGLLDSAATDFESYTRLAKGFFYLAEWVGSTYTYELRFRKDPFRSLLSESVRERYRADIVQRAGTVLYDLEDHPSRDVPDEVITAFTLDSVRSILA